VTGLAFTHACIHPGIVATWTNAPLAKVNGKIRTNPNTWTFSGASTRTPTSTGSQEKARENTSTRPTASSASGTPVWIRKPRSIPTPSRMPMAHSWRTTSAAIRPASGAERAMGRLRNRSNTPLLKSLFSAIAVFSVRNIAFCTMMPASPYSRYARGEPATAPPNT